MKSRHILIATAFVAVAFCQCLEAQARKPAGDGPEATRLLAVAGGLQLDPIPYETLLALLMEERDETLRCLAAYHVGELGLVGLRARLEAFKEAHAQSPVYSKVLERALELLALPAERRLLHAE